MSLNPSIGGNLYPVLLPGEVFVYNRTGVSFELETGNGYPAFSSSVSDEGGTVHLSSFRIVYVPAFPTHGLMAVELPLVGVTEEKLKQPLFGSNHVKGKIRVVPNGGLRGEEGNFTIRFPGGGSKEFMDMLVRVLATSRYGEPVPMVAPAMDAELPLISSVPPSAPTFVASSFNFTSPVAPSSTGFGMATENLSSAPMNSTTTSSSSSYPVQQAFVDPSDPTRIFIFADSSNTIDADARAKASTYAPEYPPKY